MTIQIAVIVLIIRKEKDMAHILRRTKGIDLKSKSSVLRGDVTIQLKDAITGKVTT